MYEVNTYEDKFKIYELREEDTNSWVKVCPERGGIIIGFGVNGEELMYLDKETFYDTGANIRGGNPILFPISGQLVEGKYVLNGEVYSMRNHGVARTSPWEVVETGSSNEAFIKLRLTSNAETLKSYPFEFELIFTYRLKNGKLFIDQEYHNKSKSEMPIYAGFHPYFKTIDKDNIKYDADATEYMDYDEMKVKEFKKRLEISKLVESVTLLDMKENKIDFIIEEFNRKISMEYGDVFKYVLLWSVKGKDFICVEPWMAKNGALNTGEGLYYIKPGTALKTYLNIGCTFSR